MLVNAGLEEAVLVNLLRRERPEDYRRWKRSGELDRKLEEWLEYLDEATNNVLKRKGSEWAAEQARSEALSELLRSLVPENPDAEENL